MILVTGATGCLGANLVRALLASGQQVRALRLPQDQALALADVHAQIDWHCGDLLDPASLTAALRGVRQVYHAAGLALPYESERARMMAVNVRGTANLLAAALQAQVQRVVHVSSIAAVGYPDGIADETMVYNGGAFRFAYMHSKHAAESVVRDFVRRGLSVVCVCPAAVIAPYCDRSDGWGRVFLDIWYGELPFLPPGGISILGRADLVQGMQAAMARGRSGERYILASANVSYQALLESIARALGVEPPRWQISRSLVRLGARLLACLAPLRERPGQHPRMSASVLALMWRHKYYVVTKAERELGFAGRQSLDECVYETWAWLRSAQPVDSRLRGR